MSAVDSIRRHPWRTVVLALLVLIAIALIAAVLIVRSLLQPQRFTALLQNQLAGAGLVLSVDKPAAPALWPHPAVQLQGFRLSNAGASTPLLAATEARIVVPWRALLHRQLAIERLEIESPRIDLDQLQALLARLPQNAGTPSLPRIEAGIRINNGTLLRVDTPLLLDIDADTGPLSPGQVFQMHASARDSADHVGALALRATPVRNGEALHFEQITLGVNIDRGTRAQLSGDALWRGDADIAASLHGTLTTPASNADEAKPTPSAKVPGNGAPAKSALSNTYALTIRMQPAQGANPLAIAVKLDGNDQHIDARVPPFALAEWWHQLAAAAPGATLTLPPLSGQAQVSVIDLGPVHARDVRIDSGADVAPLDAPPSAASTKSADGNPAADGH